MTAPITRAIGSDTVRAGRCSAGIKSRTATNTSTTATTIRKLLSCSVRVPPKNAMGTEVMTNGTSMRQRTCPARANITVARNDTNTFSISAVGRITVALTPNKAITAR